MNEFQKGDLVKIINCQHNVQDMLNMIGTVQTIDRFYTYTEGEEWYILVGSKYIWSSKWLAPLDDSKFEIKENELDRIFGE